MKLELTFEPAFDKLYQSYLETEEGKVLLDLEGISPAKIDIGKMSKAYFTERVADVSIDTNANSNEEKNPNNYQAEITKGILKLEGYYLLWKYARDRFGEARANELIEAIWRGDVYFHDASGVGVQKPYCIALSTSLLMLEGRPYGQLYSLPPKRSDSFIAQVTEMCMDISQEICGAISPSDLIVNLCYYLRNEGVDPATEDGRHYIINLFQKFVHVMNNKFRVASESLKYDTPILIDNEWVKIGDFVKSQGGRGLVKGDHTTISFDPRTGKVSRNKVYAVTSHKRTQDLVEVTLATGQKIVVTANHSLFTLNEDGDIVVAAPKDAPNNIIIPINFANKDNLTVDISDYLLESGRGHRYQDLYLDDKMMYLLGYFLGNGHCDGSTLELSVHNRELETYFQNEYAMFNPSNNGRGKIRLNVGKQICTWLSTTFGNSSHSKRIPVEYSLAANSLQLVAGYLDADGSTDGKVISASSVSKDLISDIQFTMQAHGLLSKTSTVINKPNNFSNEPFEMHYLYIDNDYAHRIPCKVKKVEYQDCATTTYYDLENVKKACQKVYKQSKYNWGATVVRYDVIDKLLRDIEEILAINISEVPEADYCRVASLLGLPKTVANHKTAQQLYGWDKGYNLNTGVNLDVFVERAKIRQEEVRELKRKIGALKNVLPIKVAGIEVLSDDDEEVYDISVENDENFLAGKGIMAHNSPFSNISIFDRKNLEILFGETVYPDGSKVDLEYVMQVQKIIGEWFSQGDPATGLPYRFPVFTANISVEDGEVVDRDFLEFVARTNVDKGVYNIYVNEGTKIATCCRLTNSLENRRYRTDSFGNGGLNIGALRVVTINLPRLALISDNEKEFFQRLEYTLDIARDLLVVHREEIIKRRIDGGFLKFFEPLKWMDLSMFFSVIGIIGLYEMAYNMGEGMEMETEEGQKFVERVLLYIDDYAEEASKYTGHAWSVEEIPGESTAVKFAQKDNLLFGTEFQLYSNQYIPLIADFDPIERIKLSGKFMNLVSGGGILHLNIKDRIDSAETMKKLIGNAIKAGVPHFAINYGYGICENGHTSIVGTGKTCPVCGGNITDWLTRIIGYFTKVSSWNAVRKNFEYPRRKFK